MGDPVFKLSGGKEWPLTMTSLSLCLRGSKMVATVPAQWHSCSVSSSLESGLHLVTPSNKQNMSEIVECHLQDQVVKKTVASSWGCAPSFRWLVRGKLVTMCRGRSMERETLKESSG